MYNFFLVVGVFSTALVTLGAVIVAIELFVPTKWSCAENVPAAISPKIEWIGGPFDGRVTLYTREYICINVTMEESYDGIHTILVRDHKYRFDGLNYLYQGCCRQVHATG